MLAVQIAKPDIPRDAKLHSLTGAPGQGHRHCRGAVVAAEDAAEPREEVHLRAGCGHRRLRALLVPFLLQLQPGCHLPAALQGAPRPLPVLLLDRLLQ